MKRAQGGQHLMLEDVEDGPIPVETGDGRARQSIEPLPLVVVLLEVGAIGAEVGQGQVSRPMPDASTHLPANPSEPDPAHAQAWERPVQELHTLR